MGRRSHDETVTCKSKREAQTDKAPNQRHGHSTSDEPLHFA
jgi:hypothetical protein